MRKRRIPVPARLVLAVLIAGVLAGVVTAAAGAYTVPKSKLRVVHVGEDRWYNFDFATKHASHHKVDWAVNLLFYHDASIPKVVNSLPYGVPGGVEHERLNGGSGWGWNDDRGRKNGATCVDAPVTTTHFRLYALNDDRMYTPGLGFYTIGTAHLDVHECAGGGTFGHQEAAEQQIASVAHAVTDWQIYGNNWDMHNQQDGRYEGNHHFRNNGLATMFRVTN
jgi:hypothetical protein